MNEAALRAVRLGRKAVNQQDLLTSFELVIAGTEKKGTVLTDTEKRIVSYHEVGHALVAALQKHSQPVSKITIVPHTSGALGYTMQMPEEEKFLSSKEELIVELQTMLGGRAAEQIVFGIATTGASNDIERATELARKMVTQYGMSDKLGLMALSTVSNPYLDGSTMMNCADSTSSAADEEIHKLLMDCYEDAKRLLTEHRALLDEIALYLRCVYWLLRLIPSRIGEILGMKIDCLKRFNGQYVLFIPTWKQNGGWQQPAIRSIHLEDKGIAGYLIGLIKEQQETARQIQEFLPEDKKGMLFSYRQSYCRKGKPTYSTKLCFVASIFTVNDHFRKICRRYNISDETGNVYVVTTHQFRHNGITDRLAAGFTAAQIAEMTGHHGDAMIFNAYAHLNLMPETIREKQNYVLAERQESDKRYVLFGGRILNMDEQMEQRLMKNLRAHRVRGGICSDITTCKSDMWNCLECKAFVADTEQTEYYREQIALWREKQVRFSAFPIICENAKRNAGLFESILKSIETDVQRNEANNT